MCGIFGAFGPNISKDKIKILALLNEARGRDSTGFYYGNMIYQETDKASEVIPKMLSDFRPKAHNILLGHTRLATSGAITVANSHPFNIRGVVGVHNGIVHNDDEMQKKWNLDYKVDSQTLIDCMSRGDKGYERLKELRFYAGLAWVNLNEIPKETWERGFHLKLMAYNNELYYGRDRQGTLYFSSAKDHLAYVIKNPKRLKDSRVYTFRLNGGVSVKEIKGIASEATVAYTSTAITKWSDRRWDEHNMSWKDYRYGDAEELTSDSEIDGNTHHTQGSDVDFLYCNTCDLEVRDDEAELIDCCPTCKMELDSVKVPRNELALWRNELAKDRDTVVKTNKD